MTKYNSMARSVKRYVACSSTPYTKQAKCHAVTQYFRFKNFTGYLKAIYRLKLFTKPRRYDLPNYLRQRESSLNERASQKLSCVL